MSAPSTNSTYNPPSPPFQFVSGGYVPEGQRGKTLEGYMATEDWYATFCAVAGISSFDERANETGQPPIDAINLWPYISGETMESPREEVYGNSATEFPGITAGAPFVQYLTDKDGYKLIIGSLVDAVRTGPVYPNASSSWTELDPQYIESCSSQDTPPDGVPAFEEGVGYAGACLFNVFEDPFELNRLDTRTPENAAIALRLSERMVALTKTAVPEENEAPLSNFACHTMNSFWEGWLGPWIPLVLPSKGATQPAGGTTRVGFSIGLSLVVYLIGSLTLTF